VTSEVEPEDGKARGARLPAKLIVAASAASGPMPHNEAGGSLPGSSVVGKIEGPGELDDWRSVGYRWRQQMNVLSLHDARRGRAG
jgi:hypothetical protein